MEVLVSLSPMDPSSRDFPARMGRYEIVERLASGGMGEVFIGRFVGPSGFVKPVAVKRIHPHLAENAEFVDMLHDEANVAAALRHPNIIGTIDVGSEDGNHFIVLDYVSGDPLSKMLKALKLRNLTMPPWVVAWIGAQVASALHAAHEAKNLNGESLEIVHRDVSLGNILLSDDGHPMLFDFGVAKAKRKLHQTAQGELKGKLPYMAPEMLTGAQVTRSVDIFSLGVVLYEILTNYSPFRRARDVDTILALKSGVVPPPSKVRASIDPRLDPIVLTAMASDRSRRFTTAAQIEDELRSWARAVGAPHEPGAVTNWLAWAFPERIAERRALLARIANPELASQNAPLSTPMSLPSSPHVGVPVQLERRSVQPPVGAPSKPPSHHPGAPLSVPLSALPVPLPMPPPAPRPPALSAPVPAPVPALIPTPVPAPVPAPRPTGISSGPSRPPPTPVSETLPPSESAPAKVPSNYPAAPLAAPLMATVPTGMSEDWSRPPPTLSDPSLVLARLAPGKSSRGRWIALVAGATMLGGLLAYWFLGRGGAHRWLISEAPAPSAVTASSGLVTSATAVDAKSARAVTPSAHPSASAPAAKSADASEGPKPGKSP
jgi:serine/threonine protein kinase